MAQKLEKQRNLPEIVKDFAVGAVWISVVSTVLIGTVAAIGYALRKFFNVSEDFFKASFIQPDGTVFGEITISAMVGMQAIITFVISGVLIAVFLYFVARAGAEMRGFLTAERADQDDASK